MEKNRSEYLKEYRLNNKEKIRKSRLEYDELNKDKIAAQQKEYKNRNKEKISEYQKQYYSENIDKIKQYPSNTPDIRKSIYKKYNEINSNKRKNYKLIKKYGISLDEYNNMIKSQDSRCIICGTHQDELEKKLCVDHDHNSNVVRGLLCDKCNRGLGHFNDDIQLLTKAINYLKNFK